MPGLHPHPFRHPDGYAFIGGAAPAAAPWTPGPWRRDEAWRHGLELFEHRYYWASHEVWEGVWHQVDDPVARGLLQALIQHAAATLRAHLDDATSAARLRARAQVHLAGAPARVWGIHIDGLERALRVPEPYPTILHLLEGA